MKKVSAFLSLTLLTGFVLLTSCNNNGSSSAASNFEGVVNYGVKVDSSMPPQVATALQGLEMKTFVKGNLSRLEQAMAGNKNIVLADSKTPDDPTMLFAMFGHKYAIKYPDSLKKIKQANVPKIEYIDSAKEKQIAGYTCKKARVTNTLPKSGTVVSEVYYTTDLPCADPEGQFKGLKGMPMQYTMNMGGMNITIAAKSVEKKTLSDSLFTIPADYKQMSLDEMQKDITKAMSSGGANDSASAGGTK